MTFPPAPRVVLDTSALFSPSLRHALQSAATRGAFTPIWSPWIIGELYRVLTWSWLDRTRDFSAANQVACSRSAKTMMEILITTFDVVVPVPPYPPAWPTLTDFDDQPVWAAAKAGGARYVVSENTHDFPPRGQDGQHVYEGIEYLPARVFLERLVRGEA